MIRTRNGRFTGGRIVRWLAHNKLQVSVFAVVFGLVFWWLQDVPLLLERLTAKPTPTPTPVVVAPKPAVQVPSVVPAIASEQPDHPPLKPSPEVTACSDALLQTKLSIARWEQGLKKSCLGLSETDQDKAAEFASSKTEGEITFWRPARIMGQFDRGSLPYRVESGSDAEERLAMLGNYQAQRNYAFFNSTKGNPILGCAWRLIILAQGSRRVDTTDTMNAQGECRALSELERATAANQARQLANKMTTYK